MSFIEVDRSENFTISLLGHRIFIFYCYNIFEASTEVACPYSELSMERITEENIKLCEDTEFNYAMLKSSMLNNKAEGFLFREKENRNVVGYYWCCYRGCNTHLYRIRACDATLEYLFVFPRYRGKGYAQKMMQSMFDYLQMNGVKQVRTCVRQNNFASLSAHKKLGNWNYIFKMRFVRILKMKIPYRKI